MYLAKVTNAIEPSACSVGNVKHIELVTDH